MYPPLELALYLTVSNTISFDISNNDLLKYDSSLVLPSHEIRIKALIGDKINKRDKT